MAEIENGSSECVILLHGMGRSKLSMVPADLFLTQKGYRTINVNYPSTKGSVEELAKKYVADAVTQAKAGRCKKIHFLTHSLGGIIIRRYLQEGELPPGSRVVMLSPPNKGSEVTDALKDFFFYQWTTGPAGQELGTDSKSTPNTLAPIDLEVGVITGDRDLEPWFSNLFRGAHDGKVSVERAKLAEMTDFLVVSKTHTFIMMSAEVLTQVAHFFSRGRFSR